MYKEPSKVIMNDFDQIYPELLEDVRFPEFTKDYTEVITVVLIGIINTVCIYMFFFLYAIGGVCTHLYFDWSNFEHTRV